MIKSTIFVIATIAFAVLSNQSVFAESEYDKKLKFAEMLEETLGHFWAIEKNLDENNAELALVHATHPISEIYASIKPELTEYDQVLDASMQTTLMDLGKKTGPKVTKEDAQKAIVDAKIIIEQARMVVVGKELSSDLSFQLDLIKGLIHTSEAEYSEAVSEGQILEMAEFQDGSAFVWDSQQIFNKIKPSLPEKQSEKIETLYSDLWKAYDQKSAPSNIESLVDDIILEINDIKGEETQDEDLLVYVGNIQELLTKIKSEYQNGNTNVALSLATKAYLDNFEFLEKPLIQADEEDLMKEIEVMMRIELRDMIKNNTSTLEVNQKVDTILEKMDAVAVVVPEFGSIVVAVLVVGIISVVLISRQTTFLLVQKT